MYKTKVFIIVFTTLVLTVPWWFFDKSDAILGLPAWALYSIITAVVFSVVLSAVIQIYWPKENDE